MKKEGAPMGMPSLYEMKRLGVSCTLQVSKSPPIERPSGASTDSAQVCMVLASSHRCSLLGLWLIQ